MGILNGVIVLEAIELKTTLDTTNPIIAQDQMQLSYDSIDGVTGAYIGVKARVGPGRWNDLTDIFNNAGSGKLLKSLTQTVDYAYVLTLLSGDIAAIGNNIGVLSVLVNNQIWPATINYSNFPVTAGDTITLTGLETVANTTSLNILLA